MRHNEEEHPQGSCQQDQKKLNRIRCWLLDMDGTITLGEQLLPGAELFFQALNQADYVFLTNNSSRRAMDYVQRMNRLGIPITRRQMLTSTDALILYLRQLSAGSKLRLFPVGTPEFEAELAEAGFQLIHQRDQAIDFVVVGFDTSLTYEKLDIACDYLRRETRWLAANPDLVCPMPDDRVLPDCGSIIAFLTACTGRRPERVIGKPDTAMIDMILADRGLDRDVVAMVGDRIYTDLAVAQRAGITGVAVLSGESDWSDIKNSGIIPEYVFPSIRELADRLRQAD